MARPDTRHGSLLSAARGVTIALLLLATTALAQTTGTRVRSMRFWSGRHTCLGPGTEVPLAVGINRIANYVYDVKTGVRTPQVFLKLLRRVHRVSATIRDREFVSQYVSQS